MRVQTVLKIVIGVLVVAILIISGALLRWVFQGGRPVAPRTELERAVAAAEESVKANPNDPTSRIKLAAAYLEQGSKGQSLQQAKEAVRLNPKDPAPYYILGLAQFANGDNSGAVTSLTKAATTKGQQAQFYQDVYVALARAQEKVGDQKAAIISMGKAIDNGPENTLVLVERGNMLQRMNKYYDAAIDYAWALTYDPQQTDARSGFDKMLKEHPADAKKAEAYVKSQSDANPGMHDPFNLTGSQSTSSTGK